MLRIFRYDVETGDLYWRVRTDATANWNSKWAGRKAGTPCQKGTVIYVDWVPYYAHRLVWVYVNGDGLDVETQVDHKNCDCFDNRIQNLRLATHGQNASNSRLRKGKELPKGVSIQSRGNGYRARIGIDGKVVNLGTFATPEEAHAAYCAAAKSAKGEFARAE